MINPKKSIETLSNRELLRECANDNPEAKKEFYRRYKGAIYKKIYKKLLPYSSKQHPLSKNNPDVVEGLFNEIFIKLFRKDRKSLLTLEHTRAVGGYVMTTAENHIQDYLEKTIEELELKDSFERIEDFESSDLPKEMIVDPTILESLNKNDRFDIIQDFLENATTKNEQRITYLSLEDKSYEEIAKETSKTVSNVGKTLSKIREKGRKYLKLKGTAKDARMLFSQFLYKTLKENRHRVNILLAKLHEGNPPVDSCLKATKGNIPKALDIRIYKRLFG